MNLKPEKAGGQKPYEPPRLAAISLRPEEAVLGACKSLSTGGTNGICGSFRVGCSNIGS
ncbi:MAG TPA: hypothetical protein VND65_15815 [Candidatus Binatia bacterium]|nr:hypothetical protein [Candidatus Binatia bacterium]